MLNLILALKSSRTSSTRIASTIGNHKADKYIHFTLLAHVIRIVNEGERTAMKDYPTWDEAKKRFLSDSETSAAPTTIQQPEIDIYNEVRRRHEYRYRSHWRHQAIEAYLHPRGRNSIDKRNGFSDALFLNGTSSRCRIFFLCPRCFYSLGSHNCYIPQRAYFRENVQIRLHPRWNRENFGTFRGDSGNCWPQVQWIHHYLREFARFLWPEQSSRSNVEGTGCRVIRRAQFGRLRVGGSRYCVDDVKLITMIVYVMFKRCPAALAHLYIQAPHSSQTFKIREAIRRLCKILLGQPQVESLGLKFGTFDFFSRKGSALRPHKLDQYRRPGLHRRRLHDQHYNHPL